MKKRILSFLLSLLMVVSLVPVGVFAEGEKLTISAEEVEVEYGTKTVSVNILLSNNPGVAGLKFGVSYDKSALTLVGANKESTEVDLFATLNEDYSKYPYIVSFFADSNDTSEGILFTMDFEISKDAQPGTYNIDVAVANPGDIINEDFNDIPCVTQSGSVTLTAEEMNSAVVLNDKAVTYDGNVHTLSLANTSKLPEDYSVVYTCDGQPFEGAKDAGTYNVEAFVKAFGCYDKTFEAVLTINPKKLTYTKGVVAQRVYDGTTDVTYSTEGKVTGIVACDDVVCEVTSQMASANAGTGIKVNVSFNLTGEDKDNYLVPNAPSLTGTITKRAVTVTANGSKLEGAADPVLEPEFISGSLVEGDEFTGAVEREAGEEPKNYAVKKGTLALSSNYTLTFRQGTFEILEKTPQILTVADIGAVNYRDEPLVLDIASNMNGAVITYTVDNEAVIAHKDGNTFEIKGVGEAVITAKADGNEEYADATKEIPVKVEPKKVTVSVASNDNTIYYGDVFNYDIEYNGFVKGETKAVLEAQAVLNCGKLTAGSHNLTPEGAAAKNYTFEYIPFNLTVKPAEIALHNNDISFYNMQYTADMDNKVEVINFNLYPVHGAILEGDDIEFVVQAQTKTAITMADTYFVQFIITAEGDDAGNYLMVNEGKYGFGDDNSFTVEVLDGSYTAEHLKAQIETLLSKLSLDGADTAIAFPEIPEGFEITLKSPVMSGETALIDTNGKRTGDGEGEFDVVYVITDTVGDTTAEVTTKIEVAALEKFSVTVLTQNGTVAGEGEYTVVDSITLTATPNAGYSFVDWKIGGTQVSTNTEFTFKLADYLDKGKDLELTATFKTAGGGGGGGGGGGSQKPVYVVDFYNGETKHTFKMVEKGSTVDKPEDPAKEGFTFEGWFTDKEFTKPYDFSAQVTASIELYAKFAEIKQEGDDNGEEKEEESKWTNTFNDVKEDDWYYEYVEYAVTKGLFNGMSEEEFGPNVSLSRAMLVTVLFRAEEEPEIALNGDFTDVGEGEYFSEAVAWAQQNGIVNGISATEFAPNAVITREQFATIMHRYAMFKKYDVGVGEETNILSYDDYDNISEYAIAAIQYTAGSGLMKGRSESTINPKDSATRAEAATILARFFEMYKD